MIVDLRESRYEKEGHEFDYLTSRVEPFQEVRCLNPCVPIEPEDNEHEPPSLHRVACPAKEKHKQKGGKTKKQRFCFSPSF